MNDHEVLKITFIKNLQLYSSWWICKTIEGGILCTETLSHKLDIHLVGHLHHDVRPCSGNTFILCIRMAESGSSWYSSEMDYEHDLTLSTS